MNSKSLAYTRLQQLADATKNKTDLPRTQELQRALHNARRVLRVGKSDARARSAEKRLAHEVLVAWEQIK